MVVIRSTDPSAAADELESLCENVTIAELLAEIAQLLADQQAAEFRIRAYRSASRTIRELNVPVRQILAERGPAGLTALPTIGRSIGNLIEQYLKFGRMGLLDRLRGEASAERYFTTVPGIGPELSRRIHEHLHIESLLELYAAAEQGRLESIPGMGRKRIRAIREILAQRLQRPTKSPPLPFPQSDRSIPVAEILDIDREYRRLAALDRLPKLAPRQFNPGRAAWLPILHTERSGRHYTALFSNTARAHQLNTTTDWVVIYRDDAHAHGRWTVITSQFGKLRGRRIVRGREDECLSHYDRRSSDQDS